LDSKARSLYISETVDSPARARLDAIGGMKFVMQVQRERG